jgi:hypothetical protein
MAHRAALALLVALLLPPCALASGPPLATLLTGTAADAVVFNTTQSGTYYCLLNFTLPNGAQSFADNGPSVSFYRQDEAASALTLAFPGMGHGTQLTGQAVPAWDFFALGTGALVFTGATSGTISFLPGSVMVPSQTITPSFSQFATNWNMATSQLTVTFSVTLGNCSVPFSAVYTD